MATATVLTTAPITIAMPARRSGEKPMRTAARSFSEAGRVAERDAPDRQDQVPVDLQLRVDVHAPHRHRALREVDDAGRPVDQEQAGAESDVDRAQAEPQDGELQVGAHAAT